MVKVEVKEDKISRVILDRGNKGAIVIYLNDEDAYPGVTVDVQRNGKLYYAASVELPNDQHKDSVARLYAGNADLETDDAIVAVGLGDRQPGDESRKAVYVDHDLAEAFPYTDSDFAQTSKEVAREDGNYPVKLTVIRNRACENEQWVTDVTILLNKREYPRDTVGSKLAGKILRDRIQDWLISKAGWTEICRASQDFNWGDLAMCLPIPGVLCEAKENPSLSFTISVNQDELLAPTDVPATWTLTDKDGNVKQSHPVTVSFIDGNIDIDMCPPAIDDGDCATVTFSNGTVLECDPEEDFCRLKEVEFPLLPY